MRTASVLLFGGCTLAVGAALATRLRARRLRGETTMRHRAATRLMLAGTPEVRWTHVEAIQLAATPEQGEVMEKACAADAEIVAFTGTFHAQPHVMTTADGALEMHGALCWAEGGGLRDMPRPGIMLVHTGVGPQDIFMRWRALALATRGYVVLIADLLGDPTGKGWDPQWAGPAREIYAGEGRAKMQFYTRNALAALAASPRVDASRLAMMGYCFGGRAVLDVLKADGPPPPGLRGVLSFHGVADGYVPPAAPAGSAAATIGNTSEAPVRVLVSSADGDPVVPLSNLDACLDVLTAKGCMWDLQRFGVATGVKHGFTNPAQALNPNPIFGYGDGHADRASWAAAKALLEEVLA